MSIEAMKLALEALEVEYRMYEATDPETGAPYNMIQAITALRQAIEQAQKQEPVAWVLNRELFWPSEYEVISEYGDNAIPLYTTPPQRQPLTDEEILAANYPDGEENGPTIAAPDFELIAFARQIEAAYGIKGEA